MNKKLTKTVMTALFMALCCAGTLVSIPSPASQGYLNLGDCFVILSGWLLGPVYGFIAGGIGSAISDVILGYASYAPATLVIKGLMALVAYFILKLLSGKQEKKNILPEIIGALIAEVMMVGGYYLYDSVLSSNFIAPLAGIAGNCVQGLFGLIASVAIFRIIRKANLNKKFTH